MGEARPREEHRSSGRPQGREDIGSLRLRKLRRPIPGCFLSRDLTRDGGLEFGRARAQELGSLGTGANHSREDGDASGEAIKSLAAVHGQARWKCAGKLGDQAPVEAGGARSGLIAEEHR